MSTSAARVKRDQARRAADVLIAVAGVTGVCVFGSVARGQAGADSDIDILALGVEPRLKPTDLYKLLPTELHTDTIAISYYTAEQLTRHLDRSSRFAIHLQREGWILHDQGGTIARILDTHRPLNSQRDLARQRRLLHSLSNTDRFGGRFLFALSRTYQIGRTIAYDQLAEHGIFEFDQKTAFRLLATRMPEWRPAIEQVERLSSYYAHTRNGSGTETFPFDPNGREAEGELRKALDALMTLTDAAEHD